MRDGLFHRASAPIVVFGARVPTSAWAEGERNRLGFNDFLTSRIHMNNENNRVLGRVLAVDETTAVAGGRPTSTFPPYDTGYVYDIIPVQEHERFSLSSVDGR